MIFTNEHKDFGFGPIDDFKFGRYTDISRGSYKFFENCMEKKGEGCKAWDSHIQNDVWKLDGECWDICGGTPRHKKIAFVEFINNVANMKASMTDDPLHARKYGWCAKNRYYGPEKTGVQC